MRHITIFLPLLVLLVTCAGRTEISEQEKITNAFFATYAKDGPNKAVRDLFSTNKYISAQDTDTVAMGLERFARNLGEYRGYELIRERTYGKAISLFSYTVKYARQPLRYKFIFYNPGNGWVLHDFRYESNFVYELDETIRPWRLRENLDLDEE